MVKKILVQLTPLLFLVACKPSIPENAQKYGPGYDSLRKTIGLPTIHSNNLEYINSGSDFAEFRSNKNIPNPKLEYKSVFWYDSVGLYMERNFYTGPNNERLQIYYGYKQFERGGWNTLGFGYAMRSQTAEDWVTISRQQADLTLKKWGIPVNGNEK